MSKIPVYFMPGLAASASIFERIDLSKKQFECHFLEWNSPQKQETLTNYAKRMAQLVTKPNAVLIGVSFGGILVQEMASFCNPKKVIIISSVRSNLQLPNRMKIAKRTKAYKLIPTRVLSNIEILAKFSFGSYIKQRLVLYEQYLKMRDKEYLDWAIEQVICWDRSKVDESVIHIHGDRDEVFPSSNIPEFINIKGGTHIMILNRFKWFNENLPRLILENQ
jgi:alpha/beta superfamily hydrolase